MEQIHTLSDVELTIVLKQPNEYPNFYRIAIAQKNYEYELADVLQRQYDRNYLL